MNGNGIGSALVIDEAFLRRLDDVDTALTLIQKTAENTAKGFTRSFKDMDTFAIGLENSLGEVVKRLKNINSSSLSASNSFAQNFKQMDAAAVGIENTLTEVVNRLKDVQTTAKSVGQSLQNANSVQTLLNGIGTVSSAVTQLTDQINKMTASLQNAGNSVTGGGGGITGGMTTATVSVQQLLQEVNKIIAAMQQTGTTGASGIMRAKMAIDNFVTATQNVTLGNIAQLENQIRSIETTLTDKSKNLSQLAQKQLVERKRLLEEEVKYQRQTYQEQQVMVQSLYDKLLREQQKYQRAQEKAAREAAHKQNTTYSGAMSFAANASSINERTKAIQYLTEARNNLSTATANYEQKLATLNSKIKELNAANNEAVSGAKKLGSEYNSLEGILVRCVKRFAALYTLNTIKQFGQDVIKVRGNMELQQKSLESILQNKTEADAIFNKTLSLATQSPFKIQDLTTYVKQLAAYRIESDKLFDTTKRLADVSAGLGVDMQRLILAYGQVKAAAYLRGSEVRQFTEAGVNMYGELQSYFKEVKGEAYTTAQIADMISKRMVTFQDVEAVFKRITDSGGIFYNMQEVQSETIYGKVQKLSDAYDIMFNQIGKKHEGALKNMLNFAMKLLNNWEIIGNLIETSIFSVLLLKSNFLQCKIAATKLGQSISFIAKGVEKAAVGMNMSTKAAATMGKAVNTALSGIAFMAAWETITYVIDSIYDYSKAIEEANAAYAKELGLISDISYAYDSLKKKEAEVKTKDDIEQNIADRRAQLQKLIDTANKSGLTFNINVEEIDAKKLDSTFDTIKKKYEQFAEDVRMTKRNLAKNDIWNTWFTDGLNDDMGDYDSAVNSFLADAAKIDTAISNMKRKSDEAGPSLRKYFDELFKGQKDGESRLDYYSRMVDLLNKINDLGGSARFSLDGLGNAANDLEKVRGKAVELKNEFDAVLDSSLGMASAMMGHHNDIISAVNEARELGSDYQNILSSLNSQNKEWGTIYANNIKILRDGKKANEDQLTFFLRMAEAIKNIQEVSEKGGFFMFKGLDVKSIIEDFNNFKAKYDDISTMQVKAVIDRTAAENDWSQYAKDLAQKKFGVYLNINQENTEKEVNWVDNYIAKFFTKKKYGISLVVKEIDAKDAFKDFISKGDNLAKAAKNWREVEERLSAVAKETKNIDVDNSILAILKNSPTVKQYKIGDIIPVKEVQYYVKKYKEAATESAKALGVNPFEKEDKKTAQKSAKAQRDIIQERIDLLTRMQKKYEELLKYMSSKNAAETTLYYFSDTSKYVGLQLAKDFVPDKGNIIKQLEKQLGNINPKEITKIAGLKQKIADLRFGITIDKDKETLDTVKKDIELIFANLKVNIKLKDLGFSQEEISSMFPKLETSLANVSQSVEKIFKEKFGDQSTWGKDIQKQFDEVSKRIQKQELDDSFNTFTQLTKNYKAQLSDQLQLDRWYMEERLKIQTNPQLTANPDLRSQYIENLQKQYGQKTSENKWKAFQNSDLYLSVFGNLEVQSNRVLAYVKERLNSLKEEMKNLDPTNLKAISEQINKIDELQTSRNPFKNINSGIKSYIKFAKQRKSLEQDYIKTLGTIEELERSIGSENKQLVNLEQQYQEEVAKNGNETERAKALKTQIDQKKNLIKTEKAFKKQTEDTANTQNNTIKEGIQNQEKMKKTAIEVANVFSTVASNMGSLINSLGGDVSGDLETTLNMLDNIGQAVGNFFSENYAGMAANTIGIIGELSTLISGDNRRQEAIEALQTEVKILEKAYDRLIKKRDEALNSYDTIEYSDEAVENTKATIRKYQAMIAEEQDKKNSDENTIREWEYKITEYEERLQELMYEQRRAFGGIGEDEYKDAAQAFAEAWIDAFNSSEDALDALTDKMDEYLTNILKKQAMNRLVGNALKPVFKLIDEITAEGSEGGNNGTDVTSKEFERLRELSNSTLETLNKQMSDLMNVMGWTGTSSSNLSSLQQGIQNVTETTAEALEAMLNSMRFMLSGQSQNIAAIKDIIVQALGSSSDNPILSELKQQTTLLRAINSTFGDVVKAGHPNGGYGLKVFMNK